MNHALKRCSRRSECLHPDKVLDGWLPRTEFHKDRTKRDGLNNTCRVCNVEQVRRWRERNPERVRDISREHYQANKFAYAARDANRKAQSRGAPGVLNADTLEAVYNTQEGRCFYCQADLELDHIDRHLDHMVPLAKGGTNYPENVVWACDFCNRGKNDHTVEEFLDYLVGVVERWPELWRNLERRNYNAGGDLPSGGRSAAGFRLVFG